MELISNTAEMQLPFPHGIEVELQIIKKDGNWIRGEDILEVFDKIVSGAKRLLDRKIRASSVESIRHKYIQSAQTEEGERGSRIVVTYLDPAGTPKEFTLLGRDPNVTTITWILEIATPPCTSLEELAWWIQTLIAVSFESLPKESQAILISTGLNPTQEYLRNLSFGEHHHILSSETSEGAKIAIYNMIRNFIPHLIALSVNSPFENKKPTDEITIDESGIVRAPKCKKSIRLFKNTTQMGPTNEFELIPYITKSDKEAFAKHVNRSYARMVDMYPYTDYGTVEIRICDTQLSIPRRVGLALIIQALSLKAKRMVEQGISIPDVGASTLAANRLSAITAGLWGAFRVGEGEDEFFNIYNYQIEDDGSINLSKHNRYLGDAIISMFYLIKNELEELKIVENPFMQAILVSIFGSDFSLPRTTGADYQIDVYARSDFNMVTLLKRLTEVTRECSTNWLYDPIEGTPRLPTWLCWWKGLEPEIVTEIDRTFAGQNAEFSILIRNSTGRDLDNISVSYSIEDLERTAIDNNVLSIPFIEAGEIHVLRISFPTKREITAYNVIAEIGFAGRQINLASTINMYWVNATIKPRTTTQFADGKTPILFSGEIETNYPRKSKVVCKINVLAPNLERIISSSTEDLEIDAGEITLLDSANLPHLIIPQDAAEGVERCVLQMKLINQDGIEIAETRSKPFYIGFVRKGPQIIIEPNLKTNYLSGELISGTVIVNDRSKSINKSARLSINFVSDSGKIISIDEILYEDFIGIEYGFHWRVPQITFENQADRYGIIRAEIMYRGEVVASASSDRFTIEYLTIRVNIDSLRVPQQSHIGGRISGWLRIRRNTEQGDPAFLTMSFVFPDGERHVVFRQTVRQNKNLSLSFGPLVIPAPKTSETPKTVTLISELSYADKLMDRRSVVIDLFGGPSVDIASIDFIGLPNFVLPDQALLFTARILGNSEKTIECILSIELESVYGNTKIMDRQVALTSTKPKMIPVSFRVPLGAEMSTAHLTATLQCGTQSCSHSQRFKIKAIETPFFKVHFSIKNESGEEIPGLVARLTPVEIVANVESIREGMEKLMLTLRVVSKREIVKEYLIPLSSEKNNSISIKWLTPPIDVVTGYYLDAEISQDSRLLPNRAFDVIRKQFTIY
ncbi:hypothetical protein EU527_05830 [Candidatus Thorarchaeota archaeon]|nr:MAG: hypothetical protein EU527_05830 [Candidatus Thorarchaeota archaeon]